MALQMELRWHYRWNYDGNTMAQASSLVPVTKMKKSTSVDACAIVGMVMNLIENLNQIHFQFSFQKYIH